MFECSNVKSFLEHSSAPMLKFVEVQMLEFTNVIAFEYSSFSILKLLNTRVFWILNCSNEFEIFDESSRIKVSQCGLSLLYMFFLFSIQSKECLAYWHFWRRNSVATRRHWTVQTTLHCSVRKWNTCTSLDRISCCATWLQQWRHHLMAVLMRRLDGEI